jgi:hypothetical protein
MLRIILLALACFLVNSVAVAQERKPLAAAEMQALLAKGLLVSSSDLRGGKDFTGRITLTADGKLSGTVTPTGDKPIPVSGVWKLKGAQLCRTLAPIEPQEVCETWVRTGAKEAVIQVGGKDSSVNRWQ